MKAKNIGVDVPDINVTPWLESFKSECLFQLTNQAQAYGVVVESFDVLDRELEGSLGKDLEKQSEQVLRNQIEATQIELQNHIKTETQRGKLEIAKVQAEQTKTDSDAAYYAATRKADADYYEALKKAKAATEALEMRSAQEARNVINTANAKCHEVEALGKAYATVSETHAREMQLGELEVQKRKVLPASTIYFAGGGDSSGAVASGVAFQSGIGLVRSQ
jgi:hypothetical protein